MGGGQRHHSVPQNRAIHQPTGMGPQGDLCSPSEQVMATIRQYLMFWN